MKKTMDLYVEKKRKQLSKQMLRPKYHFSSPAGWMNDPHAPVWFKGKYHIFFNYYPYEAQGVRPKSWGHVVTSDFCSYRLLPTAIAPDEEYDRDGCASGCAFVIGERLYLIYTGRNYYRMPREVQCIAWTEDGVNFEKASCNPIVFPEDNEIADFRDPWVYKEGNLFKMLIGEKKNGRPIIALYVSENFLEWKRSGEYAVGKEKQGDMWECPSLWKQNERAVLLISPEHIESVRQKSIYLYGEEKEGKLVPYSFREIDYGCDYYAGQFFLGKNRSTGVVAWMNKWDNCHVTESEGWVGTMTTPRTFWVEDSNVIKGEFWPELKKLRRDEYKEINKIMESDCIYIDTYQNCCWISMRVEWRKVRGDRFKCFLFCDQKNVEGLRVVFDRKQSIIEVENTTVNHEGYKKKIQVSKDFWDEYIELEILLDISCAEICINREIFLTNCVYVSETAHYMKIICEKETELKVVEIARMEEAELVFDMVIN